MSAPDPSISTSDTSPPPPRRARTELQVQPCGEWCRYFSRPFGDSWEGFGICTHPLMAHRGQPIRPGRDCPYFEPRES